MYSNHQSFSCKTLHIVNCATVSNGEIGFCNCNTCYENQGDCNSDYECQDSLICGSNNCPASLDFDPGVDCCYQKSPGTYSTTFSKILKTNIMGENSICHHI